MEMQEKVLADPEEQNKLDESGEFLSSNWSAQLSDRVKNQEIKKFAMPVLDMNKVFNLPPSDEENEAEEVKKVDETVICE